MLDIDTNARFRLAALQSPAGRRLLQRCGRSPDDISSIVVVESGNRFHLKSEAILRIANGLSNPYPLLALLGFPVPHFIRDPLYDLVSLSARKCWLAGWGVAGHGGGRAMHAAAC